MQFWARGPWRDKPAPLGVLLALSLQPLVVRSLFALCSRTELIFFLPRGVHVLLWYPLAPLAPPATAEYFFTV